MTFISFCLTFIFADRLVNRLSYMHMASIMCAFGCIRLIVWHLVLLPIIY